MVLFEEEPRCACKPQLTITRRKLIRMFMLRVVVCS